MALPDLFKKPSSLASLRPANIQQLGIKQEATDEKPQLLQRLEACLHQAKHAAASLQVHSNSWGAAKLDVDVYRQVFHMFIASMTTYRPLLLRIQQAYDVALQDAAGSAYDYVHLQTELSMMPQRHAEAVAAARAEASARAAAMQDELQHKLQELQQQADQAEAECVQIDEQLHYFQKHILQARRELDQIDTANRRGYKELLDNSSWHLLAQLPGLSSNAPGSHVGKAYRMSS
ncbi:hypothetical protein OEZ85_003949 [Tetradesmus obliquus]|uniref:Translin-associated factor X-interacting protein 1 N-terminal domain-containing protein n=1 Tax=Tetradesmus obliquus TaxID=3088 RepID=A0ABY8UCW5_TETOB|nr:hypothetical protein OEZ85_003949 [Tetradesmus obliquus]